MHRYDRGGRSDGAVVGLFLHPATCECFLISRTRGRVAGKRRQSPNLAAVTIFKESRRCNPEVMAYRLYSLFIAGGTLLAPAPNPNSQGRIGEVAANLPTLLPPAPGAAFFICHAGWDAGGHRPLASPVVNARSRATASPRGGADLNHQNPHTEATQVCHTVPRKHLCVRNPTARSEFSWQVSTGR